MAIIVKGYLKCKRCGTIFTPAIVDQPCDFTDSEVDEGVEVGIPSEKCAECTHFVSWRCGSPKCPACGSNDIKKVSGIAVRVSNYFRK